MTNWSEVLQQCCCGCIDPIRLWETWSAVTVNTSATEHKDVPHDLEKGGDEAIDSSTPRSDEAPPSSKAQELAHAAKERQEDVNDEWVLLSVSNSVAPRKKES